MKYNKKSYGFLRNTYQKFRYGFCARPATYITSPLRVLPDFFVIGAVRSGTTSLFHYLGQHPCIESSAYDEIGYFDDNFHLGLSWYKSLFPTKFTKNKIKNKHGKFLTYDVTPFYIYNPLVAKRISELKAEQTKRTKIEADDILRRLVRIAEKTEQEGDYQAAIRSLELLGKHQAMWTDKNLTEMEVRNAFATGNSEEDIARDVERLKKIATPHLKIVKKESVH